MDPRFDDIFDSLENQIFQVVFFPDRIYHAAYLNATRSLRYRYNVHEVRNARHHVLKGEVFLDGAVPEQLPAHRVSRRRGWRKWRGSDRGSCATRLRTTIKLCDPAGRQATAVRRPAGDDSSALRHMDQCLPGRDVGDARARRPHVSRLQGARSDGPRRPDHRVPAFKDLIAQPQGAATASSRVSRERRRSAVRLFRSATPEWDNNYVRNHQVPQHQKPSDDQNTVDGQLLPDRLPARLFFANIDEIAPVRYRNAMMNAGNPERARRQHHRDAVGAAARVRRSVVFFHEVTIPPGTIEGTHRHIGTEELYYIVEGEGVAYMGDGDDPDDETGIRSCSATIYGLGAAQCRELPVKPGSVIFTKSGGIHGIRNPSTTSRCGSSRSSTTRHRRRRGPFERRGTGNPAYRQCVSRAARHDAELQQRQLRSSRCIAARRADAARRAIASGICATTSSICSRSTYLELYGPSGGDADVLDPTQQDNKTDFQKQNVETFRTSAHARSCAAG